MKHVTGQVLSHGQLMIESHDAEQDSKLEQSSGPEHKVGLGGKAQ